MVRMGPRMGPTMGPQIGPNPATGEPMPAGPFSTFTVEPGDSWLYLADSVTMNVTTDGQGPFRLWSTGTLPVEVSTGTDYYAITTAGGVNDIIKVATSLANALANSWVEINTLGSGTHFIIYTGP